MHPLSERGVELNATIRIEQTADGVNLTAEAWSGKQNKDYGAGLVVCLKRLASLSAVLAGARVASDNPKIPVTSDRSLSLPDYDLPARLDRIGELDLLRMAIGREVKLEGRPADAPHGGNPSKKIVLRCLQPADGWPDGLDLEEFLRSGVNAPLAEEILVDSAISTKPPRVFATLNWGFDPAVWGAVGFSSETVRNQLSQELAKEGGYVLSIATRGKNSPDHLQGRLLTLLRVGARAIQTHELVDPSRWSKHLEANNGQAKWPYGLPIVAGEAFTGAPHGAEILPRMDDDNLFIHLATNFEELTADEVERVLALPRVALPRIWSTPRSGFAGRIRHRPGPPPMPKGQRVLTARSGPAATYCFVLEGSAAKPMPLLCTPEEAGRLIYKVGYSNDPPRRGRELNAYLPHEPTLNWRLSRVQWHDDEINAWTMEQKVFELLAASGAHRFKGEMLTSDETRLAEAWKRALLEAERPDSPVWVDI